MARIHYISKEEIQKLKNQIVEYKTFIRKQSSIARMAEADELYMATNKKLDELVGHLDSLGESLDKTDFDKVMNDLQSLNATLLRFKVDVSDMEAPEGQDAQAQPAEKPRQVLAEKLGELSGIVSAKIAEFERINEKEQRNADENLSAELKHLDDADMRTLIKGSQEKLNKVIETAENQRSESGYGILYDTLTECIKIIDADDDLTALAGNGYRQFKQKFESWKKNVESLVKNGEYSTEENQDAVINLFEDVNECFEKTGSYTLAFNELISFVTNECESMDSALRRQQGILFKNLLNHNYPAPTQNTVRENFEREAVELDIDHTLTITAPFAKGRKQYNDMEEIQKFANHFMINDEPYVHNGKTLQSEELRRELQKYKVFSFAEISRTGNESTPLLASLYNKGITEEQLLRAFEKPDAPENAAIIDIMRETRKEILDIAMTDDVKAADEKISDLIVTTLMRLENEIGELIKNPTNENITKFAISKLNLKSFLEQGISDNVYNEDGSQFIRDSVDRKLKAAGKEYTFEQIYGIISTLNHVGSSYIAVNRERTVKLYTANTIANKTFMVKNLLNKMAKKPTTGEAITLFDKDFNLRVEDYNGGSNFQEDKRKYYTENKGIMKDTLYKLGVYNGEKFMEVMKVQRKLHGASKSFQKVFDALNVILTAEKRGYKQEYINHYYNELEKYCNEYLDSHNPWLQRGKDRYNLVTRIAAFAEASRAHRLEVAEEERILNRERDISHREVHNNFLAKTDSIFGDSDQMKAIKKISRKIEYNQLFGMEIPADGGDVSWYKLIKACAEYLAVPGKRENARRAAVRELMAKAMEAGHFNDDHLKRAYEQSDPGVEGGRAQIALAIQAYEDSRTDKVKALAQKSAEAAKEATDKIKEIDELIDKNVDIGRMYVANEKDLYLDSLFGLNPVQEATMEKEGVYALGGGKDYQADEIILSPQARDGLDALGLTKNDFGLLAYMDYSLNSYLVDCTMFPKKSDEAANVISGMIHGNVTGYKFRQNILNTLSKNGNAFKAARANANAMLEKIGAGNPPEIKEAAEMMVSMLKFLKSEPRKIYVDGYVAEQFFVKRMMKTIETNTKLRDAILASKKISQQEYLMLKGVAANADYEKAASLAKIRVASAIKSGNAMSKQEMRDCYKAILKTGVIWTESKSTAVNFAKKNAARDQKNIQEFTDASSELRSFKRQYENALNAGKKEEELKDLKAKMDEAEKKMKSVEANQTVQDNAKDEPRPILTFIGSAKRRKMYEALIESLIPENITLEDLYEKSASGYVFKDEFEAVKNLLPKELQEFRDKNNPGKAKEEEKVKERQDVAEAHKQAEEQKGAVKRVK